MTPDERRDFSAHPTVRSAAIDGTRIIGTVAIVAGHIWDNPLVRYGLYTWHVPLFFALSGFFYKREHSVWPTIRNRARTLLIPYLFFLAIVTAVYFPYLTMTAGLDALRKASLRLIAGGSYLSAPYNAFWFVTALFFAASLHLILCKLPLAWRIAFVSLFLVCTSTLSAYLSIVPLSAGLAISGCLIIFVAQLARLIHDQSAILGGVLGAFLLVSTVAAFWMGLIYPVDMKRGEFGFYGVNLLGCTLVAVSIILIAACVRTPSFLERAISALSPKMLSIVLLHGLVVFFMSRIDHLISFVAAVILSLIVGFAMSTTETGRLLSGMRTVAGKRSVGR